MGDKGLEVPSTNGISSITIEIWSSTSSHGSNAFNKKDSMLAKIMVYKKQSLKS